MVQTCMWLPHLTVFFFLLKTQNLKSFLYCRWFLQVLLYPKNSTIFMLNGLTLSITYFIVRIATIPPYWIKVYYIYGTEPCIKLGRIWYVLLSSCIILDSMNIYWFVKVLKGARKMVVNASDKKESIKKEWGRTKLKNLQQACRNKYVLLLRWPLMVHCDIWLCFIYTIFLFIDYPFACLMKMSVA